MIIPLKRLALPALSAGLVALVLPWSSAGAEEEPAFSGYNTSAWAAPVKIEVYEPTVPIPASPQFEVELGYTRVEAETGLARGRGSWLWPGDPIGEGMKTFVEQLGLPPELGKDGYPVQVNSGHPTGPGSQQDEPFPGTIMRTSADEHGVIAQVGFSPDGKAQEPGSGGDEGDGGGTPQVPGLPEVPGLPTDGLAEFGEAITGSAAAADEPAPEGGAPGVPEEISALVDFTGYTSTSSAVTGASLVTTASRSAVGDVSLLGGVVTIEGVRAKTVTTSNGTRATAKGTSSLGTMSIAGNEFTIGPDGIEAAGQPSPVPGLPDDPAKALAALGLQLRIPQPELDRDGDAATGLSEGLRVEIDTHQLRQQLEALPLRDLIDAVPDEAGELKNLLTAAAGLSPKFVITLGNAGTAIDTVQALEIPETPVQPADEGPPDPGPATTGGGGGGGVPTTGAPGAPADSSAVPSAEGDLTDAAPMGAGLPPLNSVPGALMVGGIALATAAGTWLRKLGLVALGGAGSCSHGLDSGLPDLRKG